MAKALLGDGLNGTQFLNSGNTPNVGGFVYIWEPGTSTPLTTYQDEALTTPHTNPITLDAYGRPPSNAIWLPSEADIDVHDSSDVLLYSIPDVNPAASGDGIGSWGAKESNVLAKTAAYTLAAADNGKLLLASSGTWSLTLLAAASAADGFSFDLYNYGSGTITIDPDGSENINGDTTLVVESGDGVHVRTDGSAWYAVSHRGPRRHYRGILCEYENLTVSKSSAAAVAVTADSLVLTDANNRDRRFTSVSETITITTSGASGLDTGSEASATWYHLWIIAKPDGTINGLMSLSSTAPTLPSGYTYKGYVGAIYNDGSGDLIDYLQRGDVVDTASGTPLSSGSATSVTSVSLAAIVPSTARTFRCSLSISDTGGLVRSGDVYSASSGIGRVIIGNPGGTTNSVTAPAEILLATAQTVYYSVGGANGRMTITSLGWRF